MVDERKEHHDFQFQFPWITAEDVHHARGANILTSNVTKYCTFFAVSTILHGHSRVYKRWYLTWDTGSSRRWRSRCFGGTNCLPLQGYKLAHLAFRNVWFFIRNLQVWDVIQSNFCEMAHTKQVHLLTESSRPECSTSFISGSKE